MEKRRYDELSKEILDASIRVHKEMGPGLLESVYEACLSKELQMRNLDVERQVTLPLQYRGVELHKDFRIVAKTQGKYTMAGHASTNQAIQLL